MSEPTPVDRLMANRLADWAEEYIKSAAALAARLGTEVSLGQLIGTFLTVGEVMTEEPILYEQYLHVWHVFKAAVKEASEQFGSGPEATADAPDAAEANRLAGHWAPKVTDVALGGAGVSKNEWDRWEAQFDA